MIVDTCILQTKKHIADISTTDNTRPMYVFEGDHQAAFSSDGALYASIRNVKDNKADPVWLWTTRTGKNV